MNLNITVLCAENFEGPDCTECVPGFTGTDCQTQDIDDCEGVDCSGSGQCLDGVNSFTCESDLGYTGPQCKSCVQLNCSGNGACLVRNNSYICDCVPGFTGTDCQTNIDDCIGVNCSGNGVCVDGINSLICNCSAGYNGSECEMNIDDCLSSPCASTSKCVDGVDSFTRSMATLDNSVRLTALMIVRELTMLGIDSVCNAKSDKVLINS